MAHSTDAADEDPQISEVVSRLKSYSLRVCQDCGGQGYTNAGRSACFWCRGAGVITQQMAYAFGVADRAERTNPSPTPHPRTEP